MAWRGLFWSFRRRNVPAKEMPGTACPVDCAWRRAGCGEKLPNGTTGTEEEAAAPQWRPRPRLRLRTRRHDEQ